MSSASHKREPALPIKHLAKWIIMLDLLQAIRNNKPYG